MSVFVPVCKYACNFIRLGIDPGTLKHLNLRVWPGAEMVHVSWCVQTAGDDNTRGRTQL